MSCGHNLIGTVVGSVAAFNQRRDITNITARLFSTRGNYGDTTKTISLQPSSHAVPGSIAVRDQHAFATVDWSGIGAYEAGTLEDNYNDFIRETLTVTASAGQHAVAYVSESDIDRSTIWMCGWTASVSPTSALTSCAAPPAAFPGRHHYGGTTKTIALQPGSIRLHAVHNAVGVRIQHAVSLFGQSDIGAYEAGTLEADDNDFTWETFPLPPTANIAARPSTASWPTTWDEWLAGTNVINPATVFRDVFAFDTTAAAAPPTEAAAATAAAIPLPASPLSAAASPSRPA